MQSTSYSIQCRERECSAYTLQLFMLTGPIGLYLHKEELSIVMGKATGYGKSYRLRSWENWNSLGCQELHFKLSHLNATEKVSIKSTIHFAPSKEGRETMSQSQSNGLGM